MTELPEYILTRRHITETGCWEWTGLRNEKGYGRVGWKRKKRYVHRLVAHLVHGLDIEDRQAIARHSCDNPPCFNPEHILTGTHRDNYWDARERGRTRGWSAPREVCAREGHPLSGENLLLDNRGRRTCRTCKLARTREWYDRSRRRPVIPKTHCVHGHEFTPENTYSRTGGRGCRACNRASAARYKQRKSA